MTDLSAHVEKFKTLLQSLEEQTTVELAKLTKETDELKLKFQDAEMHQDRSENAEFQITKDKLDQLMFATKLLQDRLQDIQGCMRDYVPSDTIKMNSVFSVELKTDIPVPNGLQPTKVFICKLVPHSVGDAAKGLIACDSKLGSLCLGKHVGDEITVHTQTDIDYKIEGVC